MRNMRSGLIASLLACLFAGAAWCADDIIIHLQAINPLDKLQEKDVRRYLPPGLTTNDIVSLGDLQLAYDEAKAEFYVGKKIQLGPKEVKEFAFTVKDVWMIPEDVLAALRKEAADAGNALVKTDKERMGRDLSDGIIRTVNGISARQSNSRVGLVDADTHIKVFFESIDALEAVKGDMARLHGLSGASVRRDTPAVRTPAASAPEGGPAMTVAGTAVNSEKKPAQTSDGRKIAPAIIGVLLLVVAIAAIIILLRKRNAMSETGPDKES